jgi:glutathione synthase/RimK-type ligase-like ATP-grasp enzyme
VDGTSTTYKPKQSHVIVNWGSSKVPVWDDGQIEIINRPESVEIAKDKINSFIMLSAHGVSIPEYTLSPEEAKQWVSEGKTVLARTKIDGHSGEGMVVIQSEDDFVSAPLYTAYKKKRNEYRVHVFKGEVIDVAEKRREAARDRNDFENLIRSHKNGWVFCREDINITDELKQIAIDAVNALTLDFGAVDIIYNAKDNKYYVLEVNTAPALAGTTLDSYVTAINKLL